MNSFFSPVDDVRPGDDVQEPPLPATGEDVREPPLPSNNGSKDEPPSEEEKIDPDAVGGRATRRLAFLRWRGSAAITCADRRNIWYPSNLRSQATPAMAGLTSKIQPRLTMGRKVYPSGSGRLKGRKALITGGDSGMGRPAAILISHGTGGCRDPTTIPDEPADADEVIAPDPRGGRNARCDIRATFVTNLCQDPWLRSGDQEGLDILISNAAAAGQGGEQVDWLLSFRGRAIRLDH